MAAILEPQIKAKEEKGRCSRGGELNRKAMNKQAVIQEERDAAKGSIIQNPKWNNSKQTWWKPIRMEGKYASTGRTT